MKSLRKEIRVEVNKQDRKGYPIDCEVRCGECLKSYTLTPWITAQDSLIWLHKHQKTKECEKK